MADVFLSYAREDQAFARRVSKALRTAGYDVWWDGDLPAHRTYSEVIERNLEDARAVVVLWSASAIKSQWVRAEAEHARTHGKLVQAQLDDCPPPLPFNQTQSANLKGWRGGRATTGLTKLKASVAALTTGHEHAPQLPVRETSPQRFGRRGWLAASLALLALLAVGATWLVLQHSAPERKPVVAILPFETLDPKDQSLAAGMWEDTRDAVGRNPQLIVLGPNSARELAKNIAKTSRGTADYLVQANIRSAGGRIRVSTSLVRTKDGAQLWSDSFDRELADVFALQRDIAQEIEGRIRGRLAEKGGVRPENIATSGEVYALYNDARAKVRSSDPNDDAMAIWNELQSVVKADPNFAPGWATLSVATHQIWASDVAINTNDASEAYARRAIELAPNLAAGHAALARALKFSGPVADAEIRRAVALDPNDFESLLMLGDAQREQGRAGDALGTYSRVIAIEPLWWPAIVRRLDVVLTNGDYAAAGEELKRVERLGARDLAVTVAMEIAYSRGDLSKAAELGIRFWNSSEPTERRLVPSEVAGVLLQLGYVDEAQQAGRLPSFAPYLLANDPKGLEMIESMHFPARKFFSMMPMPATAGRVYILSGRGERLAQMYLSLGLSPEKFRQLVGPGQPFILVAPLIAVALRPKGPEAAARLLGAAENEARTGPDRDSPGQSALLARVYAVEGRKDVALETLAGAVDRGWLPQPPALLTDIGTDPAFASLFNDPRFKLIRNRINSKIDRERRQLGPIRLR